MRKLLFLLGVAASFAIPAAPANAAPPREESPAPRETLRSFGEGSSDEAMAQAIAAANAHPLGTLQNPIRVGGPEGARRYIARLRCTDGSAPNVGRDSPGSTGAFGTLTTIIPIGCGSGQPVPLAFDFYQEEYSETRSAPGFQIAP